jgi:hypothetical protein
MPTTLPLRAPAHDATCGLAEFAMIILRLYGAIAMLFISLAAMESYFGMFTELTFAEAILKATGTDLPAVEGGSIRFICPLTVLVRCE